MSTGVILFLFIVAVNFIGVLSTNYDGGTNEMSQKYYQDYSIFRRPTYYYPTIGMFFFKLFFQAFQKNIFQIFIIIKIIITSSYF